MWICRSQRGIGYVVISREWTSEGVKCRKAVFEGYCNVQGGCGVAATSACITLTVAVFFSVHSVTVGARI